MFRIDAKTRIVLVLVSVASTVLMLALSMEFIPDYQKAEIRGRGALCEALAASAVTATRGTITDEKNFATALTFVVDRNESLLSAALRREDGTILLGSPGHDEAWPKSMGQKSTDSFVHVPIFASGSKTKPWGRLEMRFKPLMPDTLIATVKNHPWVRIGLFFSCSCFLIYFWYLRKVLDPTRAVPKRVRTAYDFLAGGLVALDKQSRILLCNKSFLEILDVPRHKLLGKKLSDLPWIASNSGRHQDDYPWDRAHRSKDFDLGTTLQLDSSQHGRRSLMVNAAPVIGQDGNFGGVLVGFEDITALEDTRAELEKSKAAAEAANVAKTAFLANMSHEIRTPMNAILGFADLLRRGFDSTPEDRQEYVQIIHSSGQHLLDLINDILDLSKVESGHMEVESIPCEPYSVVSEVVRVLRVKAEDRSISLNLSVHGKIPRTMKTDPVRVRQVVVNLINNAIKFTHVGGVQVVLRLQRTATENYLAIDVVDSGIGIATDKLQRIFEPFSQADSSTTRKYGGTGLGLSISRRLARLMGGDITVHSQINKGTVFSATLKVAKEDLAELCDESEIMKLASNRGPKSNTAITRLPAGKILLVDDGESNRKLIELVLRRAGITAVSAENGAEGLKLGLTGEFHVILMDMQMPVMDGYTAATRLREAGIQIPIVAMTAHAMIEDEKKCLEAGCSHFMSKPVDVDKLLALLAQLLEGLPYADKEFEDHAKSRGISAEVMHRSAGVRPHMAQEPIHCSLPVEDPEFLEIAIQFVIRVQDQLREMAILLASRDYVELAKLAHWLKGSGGTAGFQCLTEVAKELEIAAKSEKRDAAEMAISTLLELVHRIELPRMAEAVNAQEPRFESIPPLRHGISKDRSPALESIGR
jgi:signal transduction histidine kinase/CheY-like chemotaxis protein/HPt (histidine-containing phosphotransfer) domain-containing protein